MLWKIIYQEVPFNYTSPSNIIIESDDKIDAILTACEVLTRRGHVINPPGDNLKLNLTQEEYDLIRTHFSDAITGWTHLRSVEVYNPPVTRGRVWSDY